MQKRRKVKMGRPRQLVGNRGIHLILDDETMRILEVLAVDKGITLSAVVRGMLRGELVIERPLANVTVVKVSAKK